jgi:hypothetical protein
MEGSHVHTLTRRRVFGVHTPKQSGGPSEQARQRHAPQGPSWWPRWAPGGSEPVPRLAGCMPVGLCSWLLGPGSLAPAGRLCYASSQLGHPTTLPRGPAAPLATGKTVWQSRLQKVSTKWHKTERETKARQTEWQSEIANRLIGKNFSQIAPRKIFAYFRIPYSLPLVRVRQSISFLVCLFRLSGIYIFHSRN